MSYRTLSQSTSQARSLLAFQQTARFVRRRGYSAEQIDLAAASARSKGVGIPPSEVKRLKRPVQEKDFRQTLAVAAAAQNSDSAALAGYLAHGAKLDAQELGVELPRWAGRLGTQGATVPDLGWAITPRELPGFMRPLAMTEPAEAAPQMNAPSPLPLAPRRGGISDELLAAYPSIFNLGDGT